MSVDLHGLLDHGNATAHTALMAGMTLEDARKVGGEAIAREFTKRFIRDAAAKIIAENMDKWMAEAKR